MRILSAAVVALLLALVDTPARAVVTYTFYADEGAFQLLLPGYVTSARTFSPGETNYCLSNYPEFGCTSATLTPGSAGDAIVLRLDRIDGYRAETIARTHLFAAGTLGRPGGGRSDLGAQLFISGTPEAAVPEPAAWATMLAGLSLAGGTLRGRRRAQAAAVSSAG